MSDGPEALAREILDRETGLLLVVTGAGTSHASGIPTFRGTDAGAIWQESSVEMATVEYFRRDPVGHWRWYLARFEKISGARPNAAHRALAELERWHQGRGGRFRLVTQNIDTLHEQAGSGDVLHVHGTWARLRCSRAGCPNGSPEGSLPRDLFDPGRFLERPEVERLPTCPECGALVRVHVLLFDEYYGEHRDYRFDEVQAAADEADLVLFVGTSFAVGVTDLVLRAGAGRGVPMYSVDPAGDRAPQWAGLEVLAEPAEKLLPALLHSLAQPALLPPAG